MKYSVGVDLGSTAIKVVFVQNNTLIWHKAIPTAPGQEALANKVIEEGIRELDISKVIFWELRLQDMAKPLE